MRVPWLLSPTFRQNTSLVLHTHDVCLISWRDKCGLPMSYYEFHSFVEKKRKTNHKSGLILIQYYLLDMRIFNSLHVHLSSYTTFSESSSTTLLSESMLVQIRREQGCAGKDVLQAVGPVWWRVCTIHSGSLGSCAW